MLDRKCAKLLLLLFTIIPAGLLHAQSKDRNTLVREDKTRVLEDGFWIYNNVELGLEQATQSGKPLLVIFRCIPCEACAQLDEQVVEKNPAVRKWLGEFVCVRVVHTNGMDLSRFQFDYDQSWAAFFMNGDGTIYGRYGTRSHRTESAEDVSLPGFLATMSEVLKLHNRFSEVKPALAAKTGAKVAVAVPEDFPKLKERYTSRLNYEGEVARSCIHCHQVGEAWREWYRDLDQPLPSNVIYPYPHPKIVGLIVDPATAVRVATVIPDSWAAEAGFQAGDQVRQLAGQPIISMADMQWVLHHAADEAEIPTVVERDGELQNLTLSLPNGWRETGDISWRVTSWSLGRMVTGGLRLESLTPEEKSSLGTNSGVGLKVRYVGQFNEHAAAKRAGFKQNDIFVQVAGRNEPMTESQLFAFLLRTTKPGDQIAVDVLRDGKLRTLKMPIQK
jgi:serine protease Do